MDGRLQLEGRLVIFTLWICEWYDFYDIHVVNSLGGGKWLAIGANVWLMVMISVEILDLMVWGSRTLVSLVSFGMTIGFNVPNEFKILNILIVLTHWKYWKNWENENIESIVLNSIRNISKRDSTPNSTKYQRSKVGNCLLIRFRIRFEYLLLFGSNSGNIPPICRGAWVFVVGIMRGWKGSSHLITAEY